MKHLKCKSVFSNDHQCKEGALTKRFLLEMFHHKTFPNESFPPQNVYNLHRLSYSSLISKKWDSGIWRFQFMLNKIFSISFQSQEFLNDYLRNNIINIIISQHSFILTKTQTLCMCAAKRRGQCLIYNGTLKTLYFS